MRFLLFILFFISACTNINHRQFMFTYSVTVEPTSGEKLELWIPIPQNNTVQTISSLRIDTDGLKYVQKREKKHGNKYFYIYSNEKITESKNITMSFRVNRREHSNVSYSNVNPNDYLGAYTTVPTGFMFNKVIQENNLSSNNVRKIYDYVLSGMHYGKPKSKDNQYYKSPWLSADELYGLKKVTRDQVVEYYQKSKKDGNNYTFGNGNSMYACDIGVGNCTDYHSYFMSLGRTLEIPVRFHMGFPIPTGDEGVVKGYHCWADYYVEGEGWYPVDISEADKDPTKINYFFGTVDKNRVDMMVGRDFELENYDQGLLNLFIYPILEVDDKPSNAFSKKFTYKQM